MKILVKTVCTVIAAASILPMANAQASGYGGRPSQPGTGTRNGPHVWLWSEGGYQWVRYQDAARTQWHFRVKPNQLDRTLSVRLDALKAMVASLRSEQKAHHARQEYLGFEDLSAKQQRAFVSGPEILRATGGASGYGCPRPTP
jgi:hypothetical protein